MLTLLDTPTSRPPVPVAPRLADGDGPALVAAHSAPIQSAIRFVVSQKGLSREDAADLASAVYLKLLQRDGAVLRAFRGQSSLRTFLIVVVQRVLLDHRIAKLGKWRPSKEARRLGRVAQHLERLVFRDGLRLHEAAEVLRLQFGVTDTDGELEFMLSLLPQRMSRQSIGEDRLDELASEEPDPHECLLRHSAQPRARALARAMATLDPEDCQLVTLRFGENLRMREIARLRGIDDKAIYRRFERVLKQLRAHLEAQGIVSRDPDVSIAYLRTKTVRAASPA